jgi:hypothetical protein
MVVFKIFVIGTLLKAALTLYIFVFKRHYWDKMFVFIILAKNKAKDFYKKFSRSSTK